AMAQRLVRRVCTACAQETELSADQLAALKVPLPLTEGGMRLMRGTGCVRCRGTGYFGRTAVFEMMSTSGEVRDLVCAGAGTDEVAEASRRSGRRSLREAAVRKLAGGLTTFEEVLRVT
ncbi:MAG TPA: type II/IV secretion system protein, partial [Myxococcaceae bacterium]|nr:type II/IV secretion system protein [Myxococcaceae bacterium]